MAVTPNYSWPTPDDSDAVSQGAAAIRSLGTAVDATVYGQGTAIAANGSAIAVLEALNPVAFGTAVASSGDTLVYDGSEWVSGPRSGNAVINGDFGVWQRGTSFSGNFIYTADRWYHYGGTGGTFAVTRQSFSPGDIEAVGYGDAEYFLRSSTTVASSFQAAEQRIEDVRTFAGQTVTLSYWAKVGSGTVTNAPRLLLDFGSGGSSDQLIAGSPFSATVTTSWQRFSHTFSVPSLAGETIGSGSYLAVRVLRVVPGAVADIDVWGVQLEAGPVATPFRLAGGGSKAAELALCQRYYVLIDSTNTVAHGPVWNFNTTSARAVIGLPATLRTSSPSISFGSFASVLRYPAGGSFTATSVQPDGGTTPNQLYAIFTASSLTSGEVGAVVTNGSISIDAEL